jgi:hypothetical protein
LLAIVASTGLWHDADAQQQTPETSKLPHAFSVVAAVLMSPRCLNCHVPGNSPLQGDVETPHNMNVKRGSDGRGTPAMRCTNCHQDENSSQLHGPPGQRDWRLPPPEMRLAWQGLSVGELCRTVIDPPKNGNKSPAQLIEHVRNDRLVNWGWNPGPGRTIPPVSHDEFVRAVTEWLQMGAPCP